MYRTLLVGLASDRVPPNLSSSATRPQQAVSCGAIIINSAMTRKPAFTAYGTVPFYLAHLFFLVQSTARCPGGRTKFDVQTLPAERECNHGNDTLRLCGFLPHWQCALWLRARLHGVHHCVPYYFVADEKASQVTRQRQPNVAHQHEAVLRDGS